MGRFVDRLALRLAILALGFCYFRLVTPHVWMAALLAAILCAALGHLIARRWPLMPKEERTHKSPAIFRRDRAPACAVYGALYLGLYLWLGQWIYLPLALAMLFIAGMGFRQKPAQPS